MAPGQAARKEAKRWARMHGYQQTPRFAGCRGMRSNMAVAEEWFRESQGAPQYGTTNAMLRANFGLLNLLISYTHGE